MREEVKLSEFFINEVIIIIFFEADEHVDYEYLKFFLVSHLKVHIRCALNKCYLLSHPTHS